MITHAQVTDGQGARKPRKLNLSPEEIARRTARIIPYAYKGAAASVADIPPHLRNIYATMGGKAVAKRNAEYRAAAQPETLEDYRRRRRLLEARAAALREQVLQSAENGTPPPDTRTIAAAVKLLETQIEAFWRRERELEGGDSGRRAAMRKNGVSSHQTGNGADAVDAGPVDPAMLSDR